MMFPVSYVLFFLDDEDMRSVYFFDNILWIRSTEPLNVQVGLSRNNESNNKNNKYN